MSNGKQTIIKPHKFRKKKRVPNAPGQGRKLSVEAYTNLYNAYVRTEDVKLAAHDAGVSLDTARKYINDGSADFPAIKERLALVNRRAFEDQDDVLVRQRRMFQEAAMEVGAELVKELRTAKIQLTGKNLQDANGDPVFDAEGKPVRVINEATLSNVVTLLQKLQDTIDRSSETPQIQQGDLNISDNRIISIKLGAVEAAQEGEAFLKRLGIERNLRVGAGRESVLRAVLAEEAKRRGSSSAAVDVTADESYGNE